MWYYEVASLESSCGIFGWWYASHDAYAVGSAVSVELRDTIVPVIIVSRSSYPNDALKSYKPILSLLAIHPILSEYKIELIRTLARRMCVSISKVLGVFITKDILNSLIDQGSHIPPPTTRSYHSSHLSEGIIHIITPGTHRETLPGVHIFPYFDTQIFPIDSCMVEQWADCSTPVRRRRVYQSIRTLDIEAHSCLAGDRHLMQYPIENFADIYYYFPHLKSSLSHQLIDYRLLDILEMYRLYTGTRVHLVAYQLSPYLVSLYHQKRFLLIDS